MTLSKKTSRGIFIKIEKIQSPMLTLSSSCRISLVLIGDQAFLRREGKDRTLKSLEMLVMLHTVAQFSNKPSWTFAFESPSLVPSVVFNLTTPSVDARVRVTNVI